MAGDVCTIDLDSIAGIAVGKCTGTLGIDEVIEVSSRMIEATFGRSDLRHLFWDLTEAQIALSSEEILRLVSHVNAKVGTETGGRTAYLVSSDVNYGIMRMYQGFRARYDDQISVFKDREEAFAWLLEGQFHSNAIETIQQRVNHQT